MELELNTIIRPIIESTIIETTKRILGSTDSR
jgi:hypothetical protein